MFTIKEELRLIMVYDDKGSQYSIQDKLYLLLKRNKEQYPKSFAYVEQYRIINDGLCAGWVVIHRKYPNEILRMWEDLVQDNALTSSKEKQYIRLYMLAHYFFTKDPYNEQLIDLKTNKKLYTPPDHEVISELKEQETHIKLDYIDNNNLEKIYKSLLKKTIQDIPKGKIMINLNESDLEKYKKNNFIEIYTNEHTVQLQYNQNGKVTVICETEKTGLTKVTDDHQCEKILEQVFFNSFNNQVIQLIYEVHNPL